MSFYDWIVRHPVAVAMITLAIGVFGLVSYAQLPLNLMPDLSYPTLTVRTELPGAAPQEVETLVSQPIEEALSTAEGLVGIESRSRAGMSDVVLEFAWGTSMSGASQDVRERLQTTSLPEDAGRPLLLRYDPSLDPILRIALAGEGTPAQARELAERELKRRLETLPGVAAVTVRGGQERLVRVEPRQDWLMARGVTLEQVVSTLQGENVNLAGGTVQEGENEYLIRTINQLDSLDEVRDLRIPRADGSRVRLGDVALVTPSFEDREVIARLNGQEAVELEVYKEANANIVTTARGVKDALEAVTLPDGWAKRVLDDQAAFVETALDNLTDNAVQGGILCILVTFLFLRDWLTTGIISTAIPISLVVTFAVMYVGGTSLNLMSLGGLALGVSMVVDGATVVLESVQRHLEQGKDRLKAAVDGTAEVSSAVFASVLTGIAVFFPIVFVEGVAGQLFGDLALAVVFSLIASLAVALLLIPVLGSAQVTIRPLQGGVWALAAPDLRGRWARFRAELRWWKLPWQLLRLALTMGWAVGVFLVVVGTAWPLYQLFRVVRWGWRWFDRASIWGADRFLVAYGWAEGLFGRGLLAALRRPGAVVAGSLALLLGAAGLLTRIGAELVPTVHEGRFTVEVALPVGTPLPTTDGIALQMEQALRGLPGVASLWTVSGAERRADARADAGSHTARILVEMTPGGDLAAREAALMAAARDALAVFERAEIHIRRPALFSVHTPVEAVIYAPALEDLKAAAAAGVAAARGVPGLQDVRASLTPGNPEVAIAYDRGRLSALGLGVGEVAKAVRDRVQGDVVTRLNAGVRRIDLQVQLAPKDRGSLASLGALNVNPRLTPPIRLDSVARLEEAEGPSEIRRIEQRRAVVISANLEGFNLSGASAALERALRSAAMPVGVEIEVGGQAKEMDASMGSLGLALGLAVFLVYVIMASTFESLRQPLIILVSVPLAGVGVAVGLWATSTPLSVMVFLGLIVLAGVVVANAIVLVDAINRLRAEGQPMEAAIQRAAAERLRPILITALNSVIGLIPLAFGVGAGAEIQQPMAITIIVGLASSTFLTLVVVPVVYQGVETLAARLGLEGPKLT